MMTYDPIYEEFDGWYFWDETQSVQYGPYASKEDARRAYDLYGIEVLGL